MEPVLVSIIVPVWNPRPDWLTVAIDSAFNESGCRIELLLVDDGSKESPETWLSAQNAKRVNVIRIPHRGVGYARNVGLNHSRGDFIRFLDGDDVFLPESTSILLDLVHGDRSVVAYGSTVVCDPYLQPGAIIRSRLSGRIHLQTALGRFESTLPAMLVPRRIAIEVGGFDERLIVQGDWDFVLRVSEVADFRGTRQPVYLYRRNEGSLTWSRTSQREAVRSTILIIKGYLARHPEIHGTRAERLVRAYTHFQIAKLKKPGVQLHSRRFWKAAAVDPVRGLGILSSRMVAACMRGAKSLVSRQD
jgi:glycosyltransferase involved in cell wall biosynthesis